VFPAELVFDGGELAAQVIALAGQCGQHGGHGIAGFERVDEMRVVVDDVAAQPGFADQLGDGQFPGRRPERGSG
jgi:hypothetical protein